MGYKCLTCKNYKKRSSAKFSTFDGNPIIKSQLIYVSMLNGTRDMTAAKLNKEVDKSLNLLQTVFDKVTQDIIKEKGYDAPSDYKSIRITQTPFGQPSNIPVRFAFEGDPLLPEPFGQGTLGYAFPPENNESEIWINDAERWGVSLTRFFQPFWTVLAHELFHCLGLGHSKFMTDLMYFALTAGAKVTADTIAGMRFLYGSYIEEILEKKFGGQMEETTPEAPTQNSNCVFDLDTTFQKGAPKGAPQTYPRLEAEMRPSDLVSPIKAAQHDVPAPLRPGDEGFEIQVDECLRVRFDILNGIIPTWYGDKYYPDVGQNWIIDFLGIDESVPGSAANYVGMDGPNQALDAAIRYADSEGIPLSQPADHGGIDFLGRNPTAYRVGSQCFEKALIAAFEVKSFYGLCRIEEFLKLMAAFTAYLERGCPGHASYVAGHAAFMGAVIAFFKRYYKPSKAQIKTVVDAMTRLAHARTEAGVHYPQDNIEGLKLGERIAHRVMDELGYP